MGRSKRRRSNKKKNPLVLVVIFVPLVIWMAKTSLESHERRTETYRKDQLALANGMQHEAVITDKYTSSSRRSGRKRTGMKRSHYLEYRIAMPDTAPLEESQRVSKSIWHQYATSDTFTVSIHEIDGEPWSVPAFKTVTEPRLFRAMIPPVAFTLFGGLMFASVLLHNRALDKKNAGAETESDSA